MALRTDNKYALPAERSFLLQTVADTPTLELSATVKDYLSRLSTLSPIEVETFDNMLQEALEQDTAASDEALAKSITNLHKINERIAELKATGKEVTEDDPVLSELSQLTPRELIENARYEKLAPLSELLRYVMDSKNESDNYDAKTTQPITVEEQALLLNQKPELHKAKADKLEQLTKAKDPEYIGGDSDGIKDDIATINKALSSQKPRWLK